MVFSVFCIVYDFLSRRWLLRRFTRAGKCDIICDTACSPARRIYYHKSAPYQHSLNFSSIKGKDDKNEKDYTEKLRPPHRAHGRQRAEGQSVMVYAGLDQPEFVEMVVDEAYKAGASEVEVEWRHQPLTRLNVRHKGVKRLGEVKDWEIAKQRWQAETLPRPHPHHQRRPGRPRRDEPGEVRQGHAGALRRAQALHRRAREPRAVVHRRRARREVGEEGVPLPAEGPRRGGALGGHPLLLPRAGGRPHTELGGARRLSRLPLRAPQTPSALSHSNTSPPTARISVWA